MYRSSKYYLSLKKKAQDAKLRKDKSTLQFSVNQGVTANTMQIANWSKG